MNGCHMHRIAKIDLKRRLGLLASAAAAMFVFLAVASAAPSHALAPYLSEAGIRDAIVGHVLDGHYGNGVTWSEDYRTDGRLDYREPGGRDALGRWSFRPGDVFCTFYDPSAAGTLAGGCWLVMKTSANCFEFFVAGDAPTPEGDEGAPSPQPWNAQGWRRGEPSTCGEKPAV